MLLIYNLGIQFFGFVLRVLAPFKDKANKLHHGRKETMKAIESLSLNEKTIWIHCASLGEFEQGRPIMEAIKQKDASTKIVLTFFSPSGYEVQKDYEYADYIFYLPADKPRLVKRFISAINPRKVVFVKYEFWYHYLKTLSNLNIEIYSVSSIFRPEHIFFKWYGGFNRKMLTFFTKLYVQDQQSENLLQSINIDNVEVAGDTRFDRVYEISKNAKTYELVKEFTSDCKVIIGGSSWPAGEKLLINYIHNNPNVKLLLAPHEIHEDHIAQIESQLNVPCIRYTKAEGVDLSKIQVLIVDTMGMLSSMYQYGTIAYIGGGFGSGIHNTIEASTFGLPVLFGPKYKKYQEACDLIELKGAFCINSQSEFDTNVNTLLNDSVVLSSAQDASKNYVTKMRGATQAILSKLLE